MLAVAIDDDLAMDEADRQQVRVLPFLRGGPLTGDAEDETLLIGSVRYQERRRADRPGWTPEDDVVHVYRHLLTTREALDRVNGRGETATGKALSPLMTNILDLEMGITTLGSMQQRACWNACIVGRDRFLVQRFPLIVEWVALPVPMTYGEAARAYDIRGGAGAVADCIGRAKAYLVTFLYD
jgi:hypothetical protein